MDVFKRRNYPCIEVEALSIDNRKTLIRDYLADFGKKLLPPQIEDIVHDKESKNTLALRVLLDELRILGVYEEINTRLKAYLDAPDLESFYDMVVERVEKDYSDTKAINGKKIANFAGKVLALLVSSRAGLSEDEILGITKAAPLYWSQLYNGMSGHLGKRNGLVVFDNWFIQKAVAKRYIKDRGEEYHRRIVSYMKTASDIAPNRKRDELPYQYFEMKDWDKLYAFLLNFEVFDYINTKDQYELGRYWRALLKENKEQYSYAKYLALENGGKDEETIVRYLKLGNFAGNVLADYTLALEFHQKGLFIAEQVPGVGYLGTATSYNNIGTVYLYMGDYEKALEFHQKGLAIAEKVPDVEHPDTATDYNNIGEIYRSMGNYENALVFHWKALAVRGKVLGVEHPLTADSYSNIGVVYCDMRDYKKALEFSQKALAVFEKVPGLGHPVTAISYDNIGLIYCDMRAYEKALVFSQKALAIKEKVLGLEHPFTAISYNNIGTVYHSMGDYENALEFFQKALIVFEKVPGLEYLSSTATSYNNIGMVYCDMGDYENALEYYKKALVIDEKVLGIEHPSTAISYNNIGSVYNDMGGYEKALEFYQKALAVREKVLGLEHPDTMKTLQRIADLHELMGNIEATNVIHGNPGGKQ